MALLFDHQRGTHQELLAQDRLYRKLYDLQYADQSHTLSGPASGDGEPPEGRVRA